MIKITLDIFALTFEIVEPPVRRSYFGKIEIMADN